MCIEAGPCPIMWLGPLVTPHLEFFQVSQLNGFRCVNDFIVVNDLASDSSDDIGIEFRSWHRASLGFRHRDR